MEHALKQRLVGAAVIIALGIIFIPMLLDGAGERQLRKIPPAPKPRFASTPGFVVEDKVEDRIESKTTEIVLKLPEDKPALQKETPKPVEKPAEKPVKNIAKQTTAVTAAIKQPVKVQKAPDPVKIPVTPSPAKIPKTPPVADQKSVKADAAPWVVQVGSFTDAKKAIKLRDDLRKKKYKAFVEKVKGRTGHEMYRVRVGPLHKRSQIDDLAKKLNAEGVKGFVTPHI